MGIRIIQRLPCDMERIQSLHPFEPYRCYSAAESVAGYLLIGKALLWCVELLGSLLRGENLELARA